MKIRIITREDVRKCVGMTRAIEAVRQAFMDFSMRKVEMPDRLLLDVPPDSGTVLIMPAFLKDKGALGSKIISVFPKNKTLGLPTISALVIIQDPKTGFPAAIMEGSYLTALRTGAASGAATDLLARRDARRVAVFGAGIQSRTQIEAVCAIRDIEKVRVFDPDKTAVERFIKEMSTSGSPISGDITQAGTPQEAVRDADVVITATTSSVPVFEDKDLKSGVHINAMGAFQPFVREIPEETVSRSVVVVDSREAALLEAGDLIMPLRKGVIKESHFSVEIGEVAAGLKPGRTRQDEITLFKSVGLAVQDIAVGRIILEQAEKLQIGLILDL